MIHLGFASREAESSPGRRQKTVDGSLRWYLWSQLYQSKLTRSGPIPKNQIYLRGPD